MALSVHLIGGGGLARDMMACFGTQVVFEGIWDDGLTPGSLVNGIPVKGNLEALESGKEQFNIIVAIGRTSLRRSIFERLKAAGHRFPVLVHERAYLGDTERIQLEEGVVIFPEAVLTTDIQIGANTLIHVGCSLHHDFEAGRHCVIMPGSRFTGGAKLGDEVFIPPGTVVAGAERIS